jgi:hypothetical protein
MTIADGRPSDDPTVVTSLVIALLLLILYLCSVGY